MEKLELFKTKLLLRNLSESTIKGYCSQIVLVSNSLKKEIDLIDENDLAGLVVKGKKRNVSSSTQMFIINSFKAYFKEVHGRNFNHEILPRPKIEQKQPDVLSKEEFQKMVDVTANIKHKTILCLMYSAGFRVSEIVNLKIKDIDSKINKIDIKNGKGKVDRIVMLNDSILLLIKKYWIEYKTSIYLFEGEKGCKYSISSIQSIVKKSAMKAGVKKNISSHSLRHSCFTQLIKNGTDLRTVQKIAGHKNINTTANYIKILDTDVLCTKSPISDIVI